MKDPSEPPAPEPEWSDEPSSVVHLNDESFSSFLKTKKHALVMFYAPCKKN
jgi:protein disulfide isomerase family A protein 5